MEKPIKTKVIKISTTEHLGFVEMSGMCLAIEKLVDEYGAKYKVDYYFE